MSDPEINILPEKPNSRSWQYKAAQTRSEQAWSKEQIEVVKREWPKGEQTAAEIGAMIGKSRNAVIGKAHRLGLSLPPRKLKREPRAKVKPEKKDKIMAIKPKPPRPVPKDTVLGQHAPITIGELTSETCHAPVGRGADGLVTYCGDFTFNGKPFCEGHCALYYVPSIHRGRWR